MSELPRATGVILGNTVDDISGTTWLLGHDLKSPVAIVISTLEMVIALHEDDESLKQTIQLLKGALVAARREYNMLGDLLDLARLELNQYELDRTPTDIDALIRESVEEEAFSITSKRLQYTIETKNKTQLLADVDVELFRRVFSTLIDNVLKFTVREDALKISIQRVSEFVEVIFEDNGRPILPGLEQEIMERAPHWEKRQEGSRTSVGMGLPFTYAVLKAHGGDFSATSDVRSGKTKMTLKIPASPNNRK
jgi:K+-sensing histidine kinase KdpD